MYQKGVRDVAGATGGIAQTHSPDQVMHPQAKAMCLFLSLSKAKPDTAQACTAFVGTCTSTALTTSTVTSEGQMRRSLNLYACAQSEAILIKLVVHHLLSK